MKECSLRMVRLETNNPHHRIYVNRKLFGPGNGAEECIMTFDVGDTVEEYPAQHHMCNVNEAADIQEARVFAHQLATMEVLPWRKD